MPVVFRYNGFRFHFYSFEGRPREPVHIHVAKSGADAKLWLYPDVRVAYNRGLTPRELRVVSDFVAEHIAEIEEAWNEHFA